MCFLSVPGFAQDTVDDISQLQSRIDSLTSIKSTLIKQLDEVTTQLDASEEALNVKQFEALEDPELVLTTNMEASLRTHPSPGARIVRMVSEKTPLAALDYEGAYWKVRFQGHEGWVMRLFVDENEKAIAFKKKLTKATKVQSTSTKAWERTPNRSAERVGKDMLITSFGMYPPNSAGGVSVHYAFEHLDSTRTIRQITFSITPYNAAGLVEKGNNSRVSTKRIRRFGPIGIHDGEREFQFENVWYNENIQCIQIDRIDVVYTDGSRASHTQTVPELLARNLTNDCSATPSEPMGIAKIAN